MAGNHQSCSIMPLIHWIGLVWGVLMKIRFPEPGPRHGFFVDPDFLKVAPILNRYFASAPFPWNKSEENCKTTGFLSFFFKTQDTTPPHRNFQRHVVVELYINPKVKILAALIFKTHSKLVILFCGVGLTRLVPIKFNPKCFLHHFWMGHCPGLCRGVAKVVGGDVRDKTSSLLLVPFDGFISLVSSDILGWNTNFLGGILRNLPTFSSW